MEISGTYRLPGSRQAAWTALGDPEVLQAAIPGCEKVEAEANGDTRVVVDLDAGSFHGHFTWHVRPTASDAPRSVTIGGEGRGRPAGTASGDATLTLTERSGETDVVLDGSIRPGGKFAEVDETVLRKAAKAFLDKTFANLATAMKGEPQGFVDRLDHPPAGVPILGDEASERVVEDPIERAADVAREVEEEIEIAAGRNVLGGPMVWGVLALMALVGVFLIFR